MSVKKPHKHAELIKAWADGATIQYKTQHAGWMTCTPAWAESAEYRIKPEEPKEYWAISPSHIIYGPYMKEIDARAVASQRGGDWKIVKEVKDN